MAALRASTVGIQNNTVCPGQPWCGKYLMDSEQPTLRQYFVRKRKKPKVTRLKLFDGLGLLGACAGSQVEKFKGISL